MNFVFSRIFTHVQCSLAFLLLFAIASFAHAYDGECGTMTLFENLIKERKHSGISPSYKVSISTNNEKCPTQDYYDSVYTIETPHFQVMYVLTGPHATTKAFADSTATILEEAWNFYINRLKMRTPKGPSTSIHYQQKTKDGLYPVEIIDINQIRNNITNIGGCAENFGITYPYDDNGSSIIFLENDFYSTCPNKNNQDTIFVHGDTCLYTTPTNPLRNKTYNFLYSKEWSKGIRVTIFHEFYHAIQLSYISYLINESFWFEASAAGFEEITNPEIDDYLRYLPSFFERTGKPLSNTFQNYGASTLLLYLYHKISNNIDRSIWESYSKNPSKNFEYQFESALKELRLDADSVFHDYAVRLSFSGQRSNLLNKKEWINDDQSQWTSARFNLNYSIKPNIESLAFDFYHNSQGFTEPDLTDFIGKATIIAYNNGKATTHKIQDNKTLSNLAVILATSDSTTWVFSRLGQSESIPIVNNTAAPHAFPVPWRQGPLCFAPLPHDKQFIEIRNRRGDLVSQEKYEGTTYCLQEDKVKSMMAPGIYRFRVGNKGKTTSFIVVH